MRHPQQPNRLNFLASAGLLLALVSACGGSATPQLIGAYRPEAVPPIATYVPPPAYGVLTFSAFLELEVRDADSAAQAATDLAYAYGGYPASTQTWYEGQAPHTTLTLAVPAGQFDSLRLALLDLGTLVEERTTGEWVSPPPGGDVWSVYSHLTVHFAPAAVPRLRLPALPEIGWSPARTLASAFRLFASIFTFLLDVVIWIAVVVGPFVLLGLSLRWLARQARRPTHPEEKP